MKAVREYKEKWEEENLLRLISLSIQFYNFSLTLGFGALKALNVLMYLGFQVVKGFYVIVKLLFLTENSIQRIERDETWIFRQIK